MRKVTTKMINLNCLGIGNSTLSGYGKGSDGRFVETAYHRVKACGWTWDRLSW